MTHRELAMELARLEGVKEVFDSMVSDFVEASRSSSMQRMLATPGTAPSAAVKQAQTLESALTKIDHNLRSQYEEFLSTYVSAREALFTAEQIESFITILREPGVQGYVTQMRDRRKELSAPIADILRRMTERAMKGPGVAVDTSAATPSRQSIA